METIQKGTKVILLTGYDITGGDKNVDCILKGHPNFSVQAILEGFTGTSVLFKIQQSSDGVNFSDLKTFADNGTKAVLAATLTASGSAMLQSDNLFAGNYLRVVIDVTSVTAGTVKLILNTY